MKNSIYKNLITMTYRTELDLRWQNILSKLQSNTINKMNKLSFAMNYLQSLKLNNRDAAGFIEDSKKIMSILDSEYQDTENYKLWIRYFDIINKIKTDYQDDFFIKGINQIVRDILLKDKENVDWRIAKKMLDMRDIFIELNTESILDAVTEAIKEQITKAQEILLWKNNKADVLAKEVLQTLVEILEDHGKKELIHKAIKSGRFDKKHSNLENTLIFGEDGGLYLLLNDLDEKKKVIITEIMGEDYLKDKIQARKEHSESIVIGKGGFGTLRFGLSLFKASTNPGDIICIKKTKSFEFLRNNDGDYNLVTESTWQIILPII